MKKFLFVLFAAGMLLTAGCGPTVAEIMAMHDQDLLTNNFNSSLPYMKGLVAGDKDRSGDDTPLWLLLVANAEMLSADRDAIRAFDEAEDVILKNDKEARNYVSAMAVNDKQLKFEPGFQDRMFLSLGKATLYAAMNQKDAARTEFNRMMQYQENWLFERRKEIAASEAAMKKSLEDQRKNDAPAAVNQQSNRLKGDVRQTYNNLLNNGSIAGMILKNCNYDLRNSGDISRLKPNDYQNAYATHFCGVFRRLNGDDGVPYLRDAKNLKPASALVAADHAEADKNVPPQNDVWIYVEDGLCPIRLEVRMDLPMFLVPFAARYVKYIGIALPKQVYRSAAAGAYTVAGLPMEELENIDRLLKVEYDVYMNGAVKRELLRSLLKTASQVAPGVVRDAIDDPYVRMGCTALQLAAASYAASTTQADLRTWNVLPKRVLMQHIKRPANGVIRLTADAQALDIQVAEGNTIIVVRKVAVTSPFVVRQINFAPEKK
ncbi:MAG: hypothetical protein IJT50_06290 [Lentisphaeria bacterium]|nr:hypothetical protein [Lentisphaeria bacterium]